MASWRERAVPVDNAGPQDSGSSWRDKAVAVDQPEQVGTGRNILKGVNAATTQIIGDIIQFPGTIA